MQLKKIRSITWYKDLAAWLNDILSSNKKKFSFKKLQRAENYKQWNRDMTFILQDTILWEYVMGSARRPSELKEKLNNNKKRKECIYQGWKKIRNFNLNVFKTTAKISKICNNIIQKEFFTVKNSTKWNSKDLWDWLKKWYIFQNFASK